MDAHCTPGSPGRDLDADLALVSGEPPPSARVPLSRDRIVAQAITLIDERGLGELTMRRLGAALGVEAMSLYRYVPGRGEVLDGVVQFLVEGLGTDPEVVREPTHGWRDFLQRLAHGMRRAALAHPSCFPLVASRPPEVPWLRPPLRSLDWVEVFLNGLAVEGFGDEEAVAAYRGFSSFLLGHLLLETSQLGADTGPLDVGQDAGAVGEDGDGGGVGDVGDVGDVARYPTVARLRGVLSEDHAAAEFDACLESLLERLQALQR